MKKNRRPEPDDLRREYDASLIRSGVRGKYAEAFRRGTNLVPLDQDVAAAFPDADRVNDALRLLMRVAETSQHPTDGGEEDQ